jgi:LysR family cys regulon transcriptional activator
MKLQQLRYLVEVERRGLNVSAAAEALFTSQPGVSKQIGLLEEELGLTIFERSGKRLTGITPPGRAVLAMAQRMLAEAQNMKRVGEDYAAESSGTLSIATTHTQARYTLPPVIRQFRRAPPADPPAHPAGQSASGRGWVLDGSADLGIATEALDRHPELLTLPCFQWTHLVVTPRGHPLLSASR